MSDDSDPAIGARTVTPADGSDNVSATNKATRGLLIGATAGNTTGITQMGETIVFPVTAGQSVPIRFSRILATGTTATPIYSLY